MVCRSLGILRTALPLLFYTHDILTSFSPRFDLMHAMTKILTPPANLPLSVPRSSRIRNLETHWRQISTSDWFQLFHLTDLFTGWMLVLNQR